MRNYDAAIPDLTEAIERGRDGAQVLALRADSYVKVGKLADALADLDRAVELEPESQMFREMREAVLARSSDIAR